MQIAALLLATALLAPDVEVSVSMKDGSNVLGSTNVAKLKMSTTFGDATVQMAKVKSITFGDTHVVLTSDGTKLTGTIAGAGLAVKSEGGKKTLKFAEMAELAVVVRAPLTPGTITDGTAANGMTYHVRAPKNYQRGSPRPVILILHGSNMNSRSYVHTIAATWPKLAEDFVLLGINGENRHPRSKPDNPAYNYTYVNWVGERSTMRGTNPNESPKFVMEVLEELKAFLPMSKLYVGGHSQGGYLTWTLLMHFPEAFAGAFPISAGMIVQAEPTAFEDASVRKAQRATPVAVVHARNDRVVGFGMGEWGFNSCLDDGFPALRLFDPNGPGHAFGLLPVEQAVRWLEALSSDDPAVLLKAGTTAFEEGRFRDAVFCANRAAELTKGKTPVELEALQAKIDAKAKPPATDFEKVVGKLGNSSWVEEFLKFRAEFRYAPAATKVMAAYDALRAQHAKKGDELYWEARKLFRGNGENPAGYAKCQEIVDKYYASRRYTTVKGWLDNRK